MQGTCLQRGYLVSGPPRGTAAVSPEEENKKIILQNMGDVNMLRCAPQKRESLEKWRHDLCTPSTKDLE